MSYAMSPLLFQPGTKSQYANAGLNTAGRIIEVTSGMPYKEFLQKRLFGPLGMKDTTFWPNQEQLERLAKSYKPDAAGTGLEETTISQVTYPLGNRRRGPSPAGGLFSTATDLSLFGRMILNGGCYAGKRYLSTAAVREMTSTQPGTQFNGAKDEHGYGLGWATGCKAHGDAGPAPAAPAATAAPTAATSRWTHCTAWSRSS